MASARGCSAYFTPARRPRQSCASPTSTTPSGSLRRPRLQELPAPAGPTVFVHGDLWQGNSMWSGEEFVDVVDRDQAGAGHPGVDLGWLRFDAAILYGANGPAEILDGWRDARGREPQAVAYRDAVAALGSCGYGGPAGCVPPSGPHRLARRDAEPASRRLSASGAREAGWALASQGSTCCFPSRAGEI